ncbi:MAG: MBL fold metallo-hydrolase [Pseudomonadota bacterium]
MNQNRSVFAADPDGQLTDRDGIAVRIWGARGSLPASGPEMAHYGGETCAVEIGTGNRTLIFDAGSGLVGMGTALRDRGVQEADLFLTHLHYDHIMGLPFFALLHDPAVRLRIHLGGAGDAQAQERIAAYFRPPFFPAPLGAFPAQVSIHGLPEGEHDLGDGLRLTAAPLTHPDGATGYRLESADGARFAYITDFEQDDGAGDDAVIALARDVDLALLDATYTPEEYDAVRGWGHAHWRAAGALATRAGARNWGLFHHRHDRTDVDLAQIEETVRTAFPTAFAARTGQAIRLPGKSR